MWVKSKGCVLVMKDSSACGVNLREFVETEVLK